MSKGKKKRKAVWVVEQDTYVEALKYSYSGVLAVAKSKKKAEKYVEGRFPDTDWFYDDGTLVEGSITTGPGEKSTIAVYVMDVVS